MSQKWVRAKQWDDRHLPRAFEPARYWIGRIGPGVFWGVLAALVAGYWALWTFVGAPMAAERPWLNPWVLPLAVALYLTWPVKFVARALSSIPLAVVLLTLVALYGTLASIPIGLIAKIPTVLIYGATVVAVIGVVAVLPVWLVTRAMRSAGAGRAGRFVVAFLGFQALAVAGIWLWYHFAWPALRYDPVTGSGVLLFSEFVHEYGAVTLRRLPGLEMSELEFYGWWPLKVILLLFVVNMVTATVRRIEFNFPNIGVLTVHTGIVTIALGSVYYQNLKVEGDMLLLAGTPDERGNPGVGPPEGGFYDNTEVVLWVSQGGVRRPEQRLLHGLPRYNEYNLNALGLEGDFKAAAAAWDHGRTLDIHPRSMLRPDSTVPAGIDADIDVRVVGYTSYAELVKRPVPAPMPSDLSKVQPARQVVVFSALPQGFVPGAGTPVPAPVEPRAVLARELYPARASGRVIAAETIAIEYTRGVSDARWNELKTPLPPGADGRGALHGLIVEVPGMLGAPGFRQVYAVEQGTRISVGTTGYTLEVVSIAPRPPFPLVTPGMLGAPGFRQVYAVEQGTRISVGTTGYTLEVVSIAPRPPFPLVTPGYEGASSSLAVVRVTPPALGDGTLVPGYERWVYSRFPEISQDLLGEAGPTGMPRRRAADPGIRITYVDASIVQVYFDERAGSAEDDPPVRAMVRVPGRAAAEIQGMKTGERVQIDEMVYVGLGARIANTVEVEFPVPTPVQDRDKQGVGTHAKAAIAVKVSQRGGGDASRPAWSRTVWVPFNKYVGIGGDTERSVRLPDGREVGLAFGRRRQSLPKMALKLTKFEMIPYEHSDIPRDYRSDVAVVAWWDGSPGEVQRHTSLNEPLLVRVPFEPNERAPGIVNAIGWAIAQVAPDSYKFSQAGWDSDGWAQSKAAVEAGRADRPSARFTILGVGNNPGITVIAAGAVMMSVGIPWAFYVKPAIMRGRKRRLQRELAAKAGTGGVPGGGGDVSTKTEVNSKGVAPDLPRSREARASEGGT